MSRGGGARGRGGRGGFRVPNETFESEHADTATSGVLIQSNIKLPAESSGSSMFLQPSLMPIHILSDPAAAAPLPSILGCYLPESEPASSGGHLPEVKCYTHVAHPSIRVQCSGENWTVVDRDSVVARWVLDPAHTQSSAPEPLPENERGVSTAQFDHAILDNLFGAAAASIHSQPRRMRQKQPSGAGGQASDTKQDGPTPVPLPVPSAICMRVVNADFLMSSQPQSGHDIVGSDFAPVAGIHVCFAPLYVQIQAKKIRNTAADKSNQQPPSADSTIDGVPAAVPPNPFTANPFIFGGSAPAPGSSAAQSSSSEEADSNAGADEQSRGCQGIFTASTQSSSGLPVYLSNPKIGSQSVKTVLSLRLSVKEPMVSVQLSGVPLVVSNLAPSVTELDLQTAFQTYGGPVHSVEMQLDSEGKRLGSAMVVMQTEEGARDAIANMNGVPLDKYPIQIMTCPQIEGASTHQDHLSDRDDVASVLTSATSALHPALGKSDPTATAGGPGALGAQPLNIGLSGKHAWLLEECKSGPGAAPEYMKFACCDAGESSQGTCVQYLLSNKHDWERIAESNVEPPQFVIAVSSHLPRAVAISGSKGQRSFALNGHFRIHHVSFKRGRVIYRKVGSHSVFLNYGIENQQWIAHFRFESSAYCRRHCLAGSANQVGPRLGQPGLNPPVSSEAVKYSCHPQPSFAKVGTNEVYGLCSNCVLKLLDVDCSFLPAIIAQSTAAEKQESGKTFHVAIPQTWTAATSVGNVDLDFSDFDRHGFGGDDWDLGFGWGGGGPRGGRRGRGRGRVWRGRGGGGRGRGGMGVGPRVADVALGDSAMQVPLPGPATTENVALDVSAVTVNFLCVPPFDATPFVSNVSPTEDNVLVSVEPSKQGASSHSLCILPSLLSSARCFESISKNDSLLSEFIAQTASSCGSTESALMDFVSVYSLSTAACSDLFSNPVIGEHVFSSTIAAIKRWSQFIDPGSNLDSILSSSVPISSSIKQLVQRLLAESSPVQFALRNCKIKYRLTDRGSHPECEGTVLSWITSDEVEVEMEHPYRGNVDVISESSITCVYAHVSVPMLPRVGGLFLQSFVFQMQRSISPMIDHIIDRCSGLSDFHSDARSDYMRRISAASVAALLARNTFSIDVDAIAESVHPCASVSASVCSEFHQAEFEVSPKDSTPNPSNGPPGGGALPRDEISSMRAFFYEAVPRIVYSSTLCGTRSSVSSVKNADSCHEVLCWSLVNANAGDSAWAVGLIPAVLKSTEASVILSRPGALGLNFGLPNCSLLPVQLEYGQVVTVHVDALKCEAVFVVSNKVVSSVSVPPGDFPLHLAISGRNNAFVRILHEPFLNIPRASFNCMMDDVSDTSSSRCFQIPGNDFLDAGIALAKYLRWLRKVAASSINAALDSSVQIPSVSLFFIVRDIASAVSPAASEYFQALHIGIETLRGIVSPAVPRITDRSDNHSSEIIDAVHAQLMKLLPTAVTPGFLRIQDLLSLVDLHKQGKLRQFLFSKVIDDCIFPALHRCIRLHLFEEVQRPSSLQTLSDISPESVSTLQGMLNAMIGGPEQDILMDKLHVPSHAIVASAVKHHVESTSKRRIWTVKVVDDNFSTEPCCVCEAKDLNGVALFSIEVQFSPGNEDFRFGGPYSSPEVHFHFTVFHNNNKTKKTMKVRSAHDFELSILVDPFCVNFCQAERKSDFEFKAHGLCALISTVAFPLPHLCVGSEQPSQAVSPDSLPPKWVLKLIFRCIDQSAFGTDIIDYIRNLPHLVLEQFKIVGFIPDSCSFFSNSVRFVTSQILRKRFMSLNQDPVACKAFSLQMKDAVSGALSSLQNGSLKKENSSEVCADFAWYYCVLDLASDVCFLSSHVHLSNKASVYNEWTCFKRNDKSLIVHVSRPFSAVISTAASPAAEENRDVFNPHFSLQPRVEDSVTRMCCCDTPLPSGTSIIKVKVCSSLLDQASFGLIFSTFKGDCTVGSTSDSWGILCSGAIQHKGERRDFLSIIPGSVITLMYVSQSGSLSVSVNNVVVCQFFDLPSHSLRFAATLGLSVTEATLFEVDFVQSSPCPPIHHEGISSACTALRERCPTLASCLDMIASIREFSDALRVTDNQIRLPLSVILLCAERVASDYLAQSTVLPSDLTPIQCIDAAVLLPGILQASSFSQKLQIFISNCCSDAAVGNEVLKAYMRSHLLTSTDVQLPSVMADIVVSIAVAQISSFSSDESSNFRDKARATVVNMILGFLDISAERGGDFPHTGSSLSLKTVSDVVPAQSALHIEVDHSQSFFPCSEELARKIDAVAMARSLYAFCDEQMPEVLAHVVPNFFVMVMLSVKKRFSKSQIKSQMSGTLSIPEPQLIRIIVAVESFLRTWEMNDCVIALGDGVDVLGNRRDQRMNDRQRELLFGGGFLNGGRGGHRGRRQKRFSDGNSDIEKEENVERGHHVTLRSQWSSCAIAALEVGLVICTSENFCLVQGPFSRRLLEVSQLKVVEANKSRLCADVAGVRAFLLESNMVSALTSAVTQRCLVLLPPQLKIQIGKHLQSLAEESVSALVLSCGLDASRFGIKLAADVQLFEHQVVDGALTAAVNLAASMLASDGSCASRSLSSSSAKLLVLSRLLYAFDHLDWNQFQGTVNALADVFIGFQIIKKFMFCQFSKELEVDCKVLVSLMSHQLFTLYSSSVTRAMRCASISFDRRKFISQIFRPVICGDPEVPFHMASAAADFFSNSCISGSFVTTKQAAYKLVDCMSTFADSRVPMVDFPVQIWVLDALSPDMLIPSVVTVGSQTKLCFPHCGWCDVRLGDRGMFRMSPACGLVLDCIAQTPSTALDICQRTRFSLHVVSDALRHLENSHLINCDASSFYHIVSDIDLHKPCVSSRLQFIGHGQPTPCLVPLGKLFVSAAVSIAKYCRLSKAAEEIVMFQTLAEQGHSPNIVAYALSEMIATGAIIRVGSFLIENFEHFADALQLHDRFMQTLTFSGSPSVNPLSNTILTKLVLVTPPASISVPPFPSTSSVFSGVSLDLQQMEDLAAASLFAISEHTQVDVLDVANSLLMGNDGNFISAIMSAVREPPHDVPFSSQAAAACAERCPIGWCTPSGSYKPLLLPCGHGACGDCWQALLEHALATSSTPVVRSGEDTSGARSINCIKCPADVISNKCTYKMKLTDVQACVPRLASSFSASVKKWFNRTMTSGSFPVAACICGASVFGRSMDSEVECQCGRIRTVGDIKLGGSAQHWRPHPYSSCNTEHDWRLLSTHGSSERIALMRTKKCPRCLIDTTKCGCEANNVMCNGLDRCPNEACNHLICQKCKLDWCWICRKPGCHGCSQSSNSSDLKERFNEGSKVVYKLDSALTPVYISRFVLDDSQGGTVKIISIHAAAQPSSLPLNAGDVIASINGIPVHSIAELMAAASLEHVANASVLIRYRRGGEFHSCWHKSEVLPSGFSADAMVFKRSLYIHSIIQPQAQPLPPMQRLQRLCDVFLSLYAKATPQKRFGTGCSISSAVNAANSDGFMKYALQFQQELSPDEAALMLFLRETAPE